MKYNYNLECLTAENDISFYLLGAFMTDGCIQTNGTLSTNYRASICSKDLEWIESIRDLFCKDLKIIFSSSVHVVQITNTKIGEWFISKGCVPKKSSILKYPIIPDNFVRDFLRGVFDGDGSLTLYKNKNKWSARSYIVTVSLDFANSLHEVLLNIGIKNSLNIVIKKPTMIGNRLVTQKHPQYRINMSNKATCKFLKLIYYPNHKISLKRKHELAVKILNTLQFATPI